VSEDFSVHVNAEEAEKLARGFTLLLNDLRPFWPRVATLFRGWMNQQFDTEGAFAGTPWAALSPQYALVKASLAPGKGILQFAGGIRRAASRPIREQTARTLTLTIDDSQEEHGASGAIGPILQYHQEGTPRMPARPLIFGDPLPGQAALQLQAEADAYVSDFLRRV
jgi:hypothetical protein